MRLICQLFALLALFGVFIHSPAAFADTLQKVKSSGSFIIGYRENSPPFSFLDKTNVPAGYSIDLCKRIAAAVKTELGLAELSIDYQPVTAENRLNKLQAGDIDILCGSTTNTLKRQESVDFTLLTFITGAEILIHTGSGIRGLKDLEGKKVGVLESTTTETGLKAGLKNNFINAEVVDFQDHAKGLAALEANQIDAYTADRVLLIGLARGAKDPTQLTLTGHFYSYEPYALALRRDDDGFKLVADRTLAKLYRSGRIAEIYEAWFGPIQTSAGDLLKALYILQAIPEG